MTNCALIIGINNYEHLTEDKHLNFAVRDAEAMRDFLRDVAKFPEENIVLCTDNSPMMEGIKTRPTGRNLRTILRRRIPAQVDNFWFFFTGHGMTSNHKDYLLPSDGDIHDPENLVSTNFIVDQLRDIHKAQNIVLVLDMCREFVILPEGSRDLSSLGEETINLAKQKGIVTIFACQRGEKSYEIGDEIQHGAFTYCLLQGLRQHTILKSLDEYLIREVPKLNIQKEKPRQTPLVIPEPGYKYEQPLFVGHATEADIKSLQEQATDRAIHADTIEELEYAKELWLKVIELSDSRETLRKATDIIRRIDKRIAEKRIFISSVSQPAPKVEKPTPRVVVPVPVVQVVEPPKLELLSYSFNTITLNDKGQKIKEAPERAEYFVEDLGDGVKLEMVKIPGGEFWMGDDKGKTSEKPRRLVRVPTFFMGRFPVTQKQHQTVTGSNPSYFKKGGKYPVENINWYQSVEFCQQLR